jgi:hypothetical protein
MAGLKLNAGSNLITSMTAGTVVTVTEDGWIWTGGVYTIDTGTNPDDGWYIFGPSRHSGLALSSPLVLENKTFTPRYAGNYLVRLKVTQASNTEQVVFTALAEVTSGYSSLAFPAPTEQTERTSDYGWSRALEALLFESLIHTVKAPKVLRVWNNTGSPIARFKVCTGTLIKQYNSAGNTGDDAIAYPVDTIIAVAFTDATNASVVYEPIFLAMEDINADATGLVLFEGNIPFPTTGLAGALYVADNGGITNPPGTYKRCIGFTQEEGEDQTDITATIGSIYFDGRSLLENKSSQSGQTEYNHTGSPHGLENGERAIVVDCSTAVVTVRLPVVSDVGHGAEIHVKDLTGSASTNNITVVCLGTDTFDGAATTFVLAVDYDCITFRAHVPVSGVNMWYVKGTR